MTIPKQQQLLKIFNLEEGMIIKNYRELCKILGIKPSTGNGRISDHYWFEEHFSYRKEGHKYIIKTIYWDREPTPKRSAYRPSVYGEQVNLIASLILSILINKKDGGNRKPAIFLSKSKLILELKMGNINYGYYRGELPKLVNYFGISISNASDWYDSSSGLMTRNIDRALNMLEEDGYIEWRFSKTVRKHIPLESRGEFRKRHRRLTEEVSYRTSTLHEDRRATDEEIEEIERAERMVLDSMGLDDKRAAVSRGQWEVFTSKTEGALLSEHGIQYYWDSYDISLSPKSNWIGDSEVELFNSNGIVESKNRLNRLIMENINYNTEERHRVAKLEEADNYKTSRRTRENYIEEGKLLTNLLIKSNAKDIRVLPKDENKEK